MLCVLDGRGSNMLCVGSADDACGGWTSTIISTTIDFMHQLCFLYMQTIQSSNHCPRESGSKHARNCVYLSKIENSS